MSSTGRVDCSRRRFRALCRLDRRSSAPLSAPVLLRPGQPQAGFPDSADAARARRRGGAADRAGRRQGRAALRSRCYPGLRRPGRRRSPRQRIALRSASCSAPLSSTLIPAPLYRPAKFSPVRAIPRVRSGDQVRASSTRTRSAPEMWAMSRVSAMLRVSCALYFAETAIAQALGGLCLAGKMGMHAAAARKPASACRRRRPPRRCARVADTGRTGRGHAEIAPAPGRSGAMYIQRHRRSEVIHQAFGDDRGADSLGSRLCITASSERGPSVASTSSSTTRWRADSRPAPSSRCRLVAAIAGRSLSR